MLHYARFRIVRGTDTLTGMTLVCVFVREAFAFGLNDGGEGRRPGRSTGSQCTPGRCTRRGKWRDRCRWSGRRRWRSKPWRRRSTAVKTKREIVKSYRSENRLVFFRSIFTFGVMKKLYCSARRFAGFIRDHLGRLCRKIAKVGSVEAYVLHVLLYILRPNRRYHLYDGWNINCKTACIAFTFRFCVRIFFLWIIRVLLMPTVTNHGRQKT